MIKRYSSAELGNLTRQVKYVGNRRSHPGEFIPIPFISPTEKRPDLYCVRGLYPDVCTLEDLEHEESLGRIVKLEVTLEENESLYVDEFRNVWAAEPTPDKGEVKKRKVGKLPEKSSEEL